MPPEEAMNTHPDPASADDEALMRGIAAGDLRSFEFFYDRYSPRVFAFCLRSLRDRGEAEDLAIEIFWELWRRQDRYEPGRSHPLTYLMKVTRSRLVDRLRSIRARRTAQGGASDKPSLAAAESAAASGPIEQVVGAEQEARLRAALNTLTADQQRALELAYFEAMSYSEVAQLLGQPLGTVKSRIRQAIKQLRELLKGPGSGIKGS